jgi:hypothetical protein
VKATKQKAGAAVKKYRWDAIKERVGTGKIIGVEVGVWEGKMSARMLREMPGLFLYLVDRWAPPPAWDSYFDGSIKIARCNQARFDQALTDTLARVTPFKGRYKILKGLSVDMAEQVPDHYCDFIFIDGDHSYEGCKADIEAWRDKVKPGGWLCGHDYAHPEQGEVKKAVDEAFPEGVELSYNRTWFVKL